MSLNDWQTIYECLRNDIAAYTNQSDLQPEPKQCILNAINIRLDISWIEFDRGLYHRLLPNLDMDQVYPFVMHVLVGAHSNVAEFSGSVRPMTNAMPEVSKVNESDDKIASDAESILPELKNCRVMLPKLKTLNGIPLTQKISMSSTPLIRHASNSVIPIGNDLSVISSELDAHDTQLNCNGTQNGTQNGTHNTRKRLFDQITVTPANKVLESKRKRRKIRLSPSQHLKSARKVRRKLIDKSVKKVQKVPKSRTTKAKPKVKDKPKEKLELNHVQEQAPTPVRMISDLDRQSQEPKRILTETPNEWNLEKMSMEDILNTFDNSRDRLTKLFNEYLKQTDEIVQKAGDYSPMDVMSMISHDQFGAMADVLYENYTPVGDINVSIPIQLQFHPLFMTQNMFFPPCICMRLVWCIIFGTIAARMGISHIHGQIGTHTNSGYRIHQRTQSIQTHFISSKHNNPIG